MNIIELRNKTRELERSIEALIDNFQKETSYTLGSINLQTITKPESSIITKVLKVDIFLNRCENKGE